MARASTQQHALNAGELSPLLNGRQDIQKYGSGLATCLNAVPLTQGAWTRRPGTVFLHQCKFHDKAARLFPFQYSVTQTYILEFGDEYIRFFTSHGILTHASQSITSITKASPGVVTKASHGYSNGHRLHLSSVVGMTQLNGREVVVTNVATDTFELYDSDGAAINTTNYGTFTSGNMARIFEVTTTYQDTDVALIRITQSADTLFIFHPDFEPAKLVRTSALVWTLSDLTFLDGPYDTTNATSTTLSPSAATGTVTVTASAVTGINENTGFQTTDVGRLVRMKEGSTWGWGQITARASSVSVTVAVQSTLTNTNAKTNWRLGIWSDTTGFPTCATFFEDRFWLAGAELYPQRLDGSKSGLYYNFAPSATDGTVAADNAVAYTLNADDVNAIRWLAPNEKGLLAGTSRGEWQVKASALSEAISPTNISAKPSTRHGSDNVAPIAAGNVVLFVQRASRKLRELAYVFEADGFKAPDMTVLSEHITAGGMTELAYQEQPQAVLWSARGDGALLGMSYERDQDVVAWHRHELGGASDADGEDIPVVESIAAVPAPDSSRDELYLIVQRYVNGGTKRYVEYMSKLWEQSTDEQEDAFFFDCGYTSVASPASDTVTGLWHLEGETVSAYVDGTKHIPVTVANGTVTLERAGYVRTIGYAYNSDGQIMPVEGGSQDGSSQGKKKRIGRAGFWLLDTLGLKVGPDFDNLTEVLVRNWGDNYGTATPLFTGVVRERIESSSDRVGQYCWRADGPFPATVLSTMPQFETSDDS